MHPRDSSPVFMYLHVWITHSGQDYDPTLASTPARALLGPF